MFSDRFITISGIDLWPTPQPVDSALYAARTFVANCEPRAGLPPRGRSAEPVPQISGQPSPEMKRPGGKTCYQRALCILKGRPTESWAPDGEGHSCWGYAGRILKTAKADDQQPAEARHRFGSV